MTLQALAAVLGGTQSLHTNSLDETLALPTEEAVKIALRTQQIIAHESGVTNTVDPLGGAYYLEWLTNRMESEAIGYFDKLDEMGGMIRAIERGFPQSEIHRAALSHIKKRSTQVSALSSASMRSPSPSGHRSKFSGSAREWSAARFKSCGTEKDSAAKGGYAPP